MSDDGRRKDDGHPTPCPLLADHMNISANILADLKAIKETQHSMMEMIAAWNSTKGFVKTMQLLGAVAKWMTIIGGAVTLLVLWFRR